MPLVSHVALVLLAVCFYEPRVVNGVQFAAIADNLDLSTTMINAQSAGTAVDVQSCLDAAYLSDPTIVAFSFDNSTGDCSYSTKIFGSFLREPGTLPSFFLRMDDIMQPSANNTCLTLQDAEYLIMEMSYSNQTCVQGSLDAATSLCIATEYSFPYGNYAAGNLRDGTQYLLTKDLAAESVNYQCSGQQDTKMKFFGRWYCYIAYVLSPSEISLGATLISNDYCSQAYDSDTHVVKIVESREYGYLYWFWPEKVIHIGATLQSGTTYKWCGGAYNGTAADDLPWATGRPIGGSNTLVRVNSDFSVTDTTAANMTIIVCKRLATNYVYDPSVKFL